MTLCTQKISSEYYNDSMFQPVIDASVVLRFESDFGLSSIWTDLTGNGDGTSTLGATRSVLDSTGIFGSNFYFNGIDGSISVANRPNLNFSTNAFTIEVWCRPELNGTSGVLIDKAYLNHRSPWYSYNLRISYSPIRQIEFYTSPDSGLGGVLTSTIFPISLSFLGTWHHIAASYDNMNMKLYIDGVLSNTTPASGNLGIFDTPLIIGKFRNITTTGFFKGNINGIRIYNRTLSDSEIYNNYTHSPIYYILKR